MQVELDTANQRIDFLLQRLVDGGMTENALQDESDREMKPKPGPTNWREQQARLARRSAHNLSLYVAEQKRAYRAERQNLSEQMIKAGFGDDSE